MQLLMPGSIAPHILLFAGYNSSGQVCCYAHNGALNFAKYSFKPGSNYYYREHTPSCNMGAKVIRLSTLDPNPSVPGASVSDANLPKASFSPVKDAEYTEQNTEIILSIGSPYIFVNGRRHNIDNEGTKPFIHNSRTMLPIRFIAESFGHSVEGDNITQSVIIN